MCSSLHWTTYATALSLCWGILSLGGTSLLFLKKILLSFSNTPAMYRMTKSLCLFFLFSSVFGAIVYIYCIHIYSIYFPFRFLGQLDKGPVWVYAGLKCSLDVLVLLFFFLCLSGNILSGVKFWWWILGVSVCDANQKADLSFSFQWSSFRLPSSSICAALYNNGSLLFSASSLVNLELPSSEDLCFSTSGFKPVAWCCSLVAAQCFTFHFLPIDVGCYGKTAHLWY